ncbi:MAG TPA: hypothetical protein ENL39_00995 [Candidatus Aerophobetes bacterium]|uniref:Uncharacterized protein n=1 Tax=Aerophobetes bacterium TaxID=2030807 RepID=A0A7V5HYQ7_UNCAE|nr:hypothetical protein [Candidatus Aerophobetes bacterium]
MPRSLGWGSVFVLQWVTRMAELGGLGLGFRPAITLTRPCWGSVFVLQWVTRMAELGGLGLGFRPAMGCRYLNIKIFI